MPDKVPKRQVGPGLPNREYAEWSLMTEEYYATLEPVDLGLAEAAEPEYTTVD
jgi:hypothetical protein